MSFWEKVKDKIPRIPDIKIEPTGIGFKLNINFHIGEKHYHFETKDDAKILKPATQEELKKRVDEKIKTQLPEFEKISEPQLIDRFAETVAASAAEIVSGQPLIQVFSPSGSLQAESKAIGHATSRVESAPISHTTNTSEPID